MNKLILLLGIDGLLRLDTTAVEASRNLLDQPCPIMSFRIVVRPWICCRRSCRNYKRNNSRINEMIDYSYIQQMKLNILKIL